MITSQQRRIDILRRENIFTFKTIKSNIITNEEDHSL